MKPALGNWLILIFIIGVFITLLKKLFPLKDVHDTNEDDE